MVCSENVAHRTFEEKRKSCLQDKAHRGDDCQYCNSSDEILRSMLRRKLVEGIPSPQTCL
jgi:hypothetical protein